MEQLFVYILCILLGILTDFCSSTEIDNFKDGNYRLNTDVIPLHYTVDLTSYFDTNLNGKQLLPNRTKRTGRLDYIQCTTVR